MSNLKKLTKKEINIIFEDIINIGNNIIKDIIDIRESLIYYMDSESFKINNITNEIEKINNKIFVLIEDMLYDNIKKSNFFFLKGIEFKTVDDDKNKDLYVLFLKNLSIGDGTVDFFLEFHIYKKYFFNNIVLSTPDEFKDFLIYFTVSIVHELKHVLQFFSVINKNDISDKSFQISIEKLVRGYTMSTILYFLHPMELDAYAFSFAYFLSDKFRTFDEAAKYLKSLNEDKIIELSSKYKLKFVYFYLILIKGGTIYKKFIMKTLKYIEEIFNKNNKNMKR